MGKDTKNTAEHSDSDLHKTPAKHSYQEDVKTSKHATRYLFVGITLAVFNYCSYAILSNLIIKNNSLIWLSSFIASFITTILAYILHSKITWKERPLSKTALYKFFIWNILLTVAINPGLTQLFSLLTPLYEFTFHIFETLHIPFSYEFTLTTGAFVLTAIITTIMNFFLYDKFVFGKTKQNKEEK